MVDGDAVYWSEARPLEDGRDVIVRWRDGALEDVIPAGWSARTRVHEYGGGAYAVRDGVVYFCRDSDQRVYVGSNPVSPAGARYADLQVDGDRWSSACASAETSPEHTNDLVEIVDGEVRVLASRPRLLLLAAGARRRRSPSSPGITRGCRGRAASSTCSRTAS